MLPHRLALLLSYRGDLWHGFARQGDLPTVENHLRQALGQVLGAAPWALVPAGRTDAGVHALGQVVSFKTAAPAPATSLPAAINACLPHGIWVRACTEVPRRFHARASARLRWYRYLVEDAENPVTGETPRRSWRLPVRLDVDAMQQAAACLRGRHDFTSFAMRPRENANNVCNIEELHVRHGGGLTVLDVRADRFLRRMVRTLVGTLVEVGSGERAAGDLDSALAARQRLAAGRTAPAHGLHLMRVLYDPDDLGVPAGEREGSGSSRPQSSLVSISTSCA
ncbi:MAG: tRNA pseudouridine(38-40) synthase TruA [Pseudomonadota bacterium]